MEEDGLSGELRGRVLVVDSGVGGLTVAKEISRRMPAVEMIYMCDNAQFPYGTMSVSRLTERVARLCLTAIASADLDVIVLACNTASTVSLDRLRALSALPVVGVVPAIKPAAARTQTRSIGVLATSGTVQRAYLRDLITKFANGCAVLPIGSDRLVEIAEQKLRGVPVELTDIAAIVEPFFSEEVRPRIDTVVLGCTHFALLRKELAELSAGDICWLDSGAAIATRVQTLLQSRVGGRKAPLAAPASRVIFTAPASASYQDAFRPFGFVDAEVARV